MDNTSKASTRDKIALLRGLRQIRQFGPQPVPEAALHDILEVGRWTGSGMNRQLWEFVVVRNQDTLRAIAQEENANSHLAGAQAAIVVVMGGEAGGINTYDEGRLAERLLLAAAAHGVGAGIWWFKDGGAAAKRILGIPDDRHVRTAISLGYPPAEAEARPKRTDARKPLAELVHEEHY
jgi:nitroreductase